MRLFYRRKNEVAPDAKPSEIGLFIYAQLRILSASLSRYERRMTTGQKKWVISLFCLIMTAISMGILYQGLFGKKSRSPSFLATPGISRPVIPHLPDSILQRHWRLRLTDSAKVKSKPDFIIK